jgi:hypothetical protein
MDVDKQDITNTTEVWGRKGGSLGYNNNDDECYDVENL